MIETQQQDNNAFLDIAANLLAIIMIITMFSLVTVRYNAHSASDPDAVEDPTLRFVTPQRDLFPPFSAFYFVLADRVVLWDQAAIIDALQNNPGTLSGRTTQGRYQWFAEPLTPWDIDTYQIKFFLDEQAVIAAIAPLAEQDQQPFLDELSRRYAAERSAPVFIVYPDGMEVFARLYPGLQDAELRFRWFARARGTPLHLGRTPGQFTDYGIYW